MDIFTVSDFEKAFKDRSPRIQGIKDSFAVTVPLVDIGGEAHILYELRSRHIDRQPGEVCFPGGQIEKGETPLQAALRETWEEIGLKEDQIEVISALDVFHPPSDIVLYPFLVKIDAAALNSLKLSECEVQECFTVPVSFLMNRQPYEYTHPVEYTLGEDFRYDKIGLAEKTYDWRAMQHRIISWEYEGKYIWGMTALITEWTLKILKDENK